MEVLFLRLFRDWTRLFGDRAASQSSSPEHLSPPDTVLKAVLGFLQHWSSPAGTCSPLQAEQKYMVSVFLGDNYSCPTSHNEVNTSADPLLSHPLLCFEPSCCVWGCLGGVSPNKDLKPSGLHGSSYHRWLLMHLQCSNQEENLAKVVLVVSEEIGTLQGEVKWCEPAVFSLFSFLLFFVFLLAGSSSLLDLRALLCFFCPAAFPLTQINKLSPLSSFSHALHQYVKKYKRKILC